MFAVAALLTSSSAIAAVSPQPEQPQPDDSLTCAIKLRDLTNALHMYSQQHNGSLPTNMHAALMAMPNIAAAGVLDAKAASERLISPAHRGRIPIPAEPTPEWVEQNSSYRYLGNEYVNLDDIASWDDIVIAHLRLEQGHSVEPDPLNPEGEMFPVAFLDGHIELMPRADAQRRIDESAAVLDSFRTGKKMPDDREVLQNLVVMMKAVRAYAAANDGKLPATLGAAYPYIPGGTPRLATSAQRAAVFLSPRAQVRNAIPTEPTPEWIDANCSYLYLGNSSHSLKKVPEPGSIVLITGRSDDTYRRNQVGGPPVDVIPLATVAGSVALHQRAYVDWNRRQSEQVFLAMSEQAAQPDWVHAACDIRAINEMILRYTQAHEGRLPADLGDLVDVDAGGRVPLPDRVELVFVSPRREAAMSDPSQRSADWVRKNGTYQYIPALTPKKETLADLHEMQAEVLVCGGSDDVYKIMSPTGEMTEVVPMVSTMGYAGLFPKEWVLSQASESIQKVQQAAGTRK